MASSSSTAPSPHPSPQEYASLHRILNVSKSSVQEPKPLTGQQVMVPITTKAFFQGTLAPSTISTTSTTLSENDTTTNDLMSRERVLMNLGEGYMAEMTRDDACDVIKRRCATVNSTAPMAARGSKKEEDGKLVMKKGFLNKTQHSKKKNNRKKKEIKHVGAKINRESCPDILQSCPSQQKGPSLQTRQRQEQKEQDTERKEQLTAETSPVLPYFEIREEYDKDGNEIVAEALNVSAQLKELQEVLNNEDQDEVNTSQRAAKVTARMENEDDKIKKRHEIIQALSSNLEVRQEEIQHDTSVSTADGYCRKKEEDHGNMKSSCTDKKEIDYEKISVRLKELTKLEEEDEQNKSMNSNSSKSLQGKGWAKGFFNEKNRRNTRKQKVKSILDIDTANDRKLADAENTVVRNMSTKGGAKKKGGCRVKFSGSDEVKEIPRVSNKVKETPRVSTATASSPNIMNQYISGDRGMSETVLQRPRDNESNHSKKKVSMGSVMERNVSNTTGSDVRQQTTHVPTKRPLSRFAQQRLNKF